MKSEMEYQKLSQREHVLKRPGMYIGSVEPQTQETWTVQEGKIKRKTVTFVPGFIKIFDEIIQNAIDHSQNPENKVTAIKVSVSGDKIQVWNNGVGIPIRQQEGVYIPEMIFGQLLSGSNYDDTKDRVTAGTYGIGSKATNIYSKTFRVETVCNREKFIIEFQDNMIKKTKPKITNCNNSDFTKITFVPDYRLFGMPGMEIETEMLLQKRVYDAIPCTSPTVSIYFNGDKIKGKGLADYQKYYTSGTETVFYQCNTDAKYIWEYVIVPSECGFEQVSFVNGNNTISGGKHVDYINNQIQTKLKDLIQASKKIKDLKPSIIKDAYKLFLRATVKNPQFNSQTKEYLITTPKDFGTKVEVPDTFIRKLFKSKITDIVMENFTTKQQRELKKQVDGKKMLRVIVPNLEDAIWAGGSKSECCSLILTEGLSAMTFAIWGRSVVGNNKYGVFPLKGKFLNIRDATASQIKNNQEVINLMKIIGLKTGVKYKTTADLRYQKVILLTDADNDGHHIKGLVMNFFHCLFPELLHLSFIQTIKTPILKATKGKNTLEFFTNADYTNWVSTQNPFGYKVKYYKGLGTSTKSDAKEIFGRLGELKVEYKHKSIRCDTSMILAFGKDKKSSTDMRKTWINNYNEMECVIPVSKEISYTDFVNKELIHFSVADNRRSIPSVIDGLKPSQRKVLYYLIKKNITTSQKVAQLSGYISAETGYHHGEVSLQQTIINMAANYIGSNNINLLYPDGNFGSRLSGQDAASPRYIYTRLEDDTTKLFPSEDLPILDYLQEDGMVIEPKFLVPIVPMVLVNGCSGIGTGYSTNIPSYNIIDICKNLDNYLDNKELEDMVPFYKNFRGSVTKDLSREGYYTISGCFTRTSDAVITINEIPAGNYLIPFMNCLNKLIEIDYIQDAKNLSKDENTDICVVVKFQNKQDLDVKMPELLDKLKLTKTVNTNNMYLFDKSGMITKYNTTNDIIREYAKTRIEYYEMKRVHLLSVYKLELDILKNKARFIRKYIAGDLDINLKSREMVKKILDKYKFMKISDEYNYLLQLPMSSLTREKVTYLDNEITKLQDKCEYYETNTSKSLWTTDLKSLVVC